MSAPIVSDLPSRADYRYFTSFETRWSDNDGFGHVNNVEYYRFFEIIVAKFFLGPAATDFAVAPVIPFAAESMCRYRKPLSFPEIVDGALRVEHLGTSSVRYGLALFRHGAAEPAAYGHWVHVFVDRATQRPAPIPDAVRAAFAAVAVG